MRAEGRRQQLGLISWIDNTIKPKSSKTCTAAVDSSNTLSTVRRKRPQAEVVGFTSAQCPFPRWLVSPTPGRRNLASLSFTSSQIASRFSVSSLESDSPDRFSRLRLSESGPVPRQCGPSSQPSVQSDTPLHSLLMWMQTSVPPHRYSLGGQRATVLGGPDQDKRE